MKSSLLSLFVLTLLGSACSKSETTPTNGFLGKPDPAPVGEDIGPLGDEEGSQEEQQNEEQTENEEDEIDVTDVTDEQNEEEVPEEEINVVTIGPNDPCYRFMSDTVSKPVANCTQMINGNLEDSYDNVVKFGKICVLKSSYNNNISVFTIDGNFTEVDEDWNRRSYKVYGFKETKIENDRVEFSFKDDGIKTSIRYDITDEALRIKQATRLFGKKLRYFELGCTPINPIR